MALTKERFLEIYANLPIGVRTEIIVVINSQPITWNVAQNEINGNTELGKRILAKLDSFGFME